jgi:hypothetical protein
MTDELTDELHRLPRPTAPAELRERVLSAVGRELSNRKRRVPRWERAAEIAVAASLVLGVGMNVWQWRADRAWHQRLFEPRVAGYDSIDQGAALAGSDPQLAQLARQRTIPRATGWDNWQQRSQQQAQLLREIVTNGGG